MNIGYARVSKTDESQALDLQIDALKKAGVKMDKIYKDLTSDAKDERPGLSACLKSMRKGDVLVVWKLDRLGSGLKNLVNTIEELNKNEIGLKVISGMGAEIDTTKANGKLVFGIFASLAEFERELIREETLAGLQSPRSAGRAAGRKAKMTKAKVWLAQSAMGKKETVVSDLCKELGIARQTLYRYVGPRGEIRELGRKALEK